MIYKILSLPSGFIIGSTYDHHILKHFSYFKIGNKLNEQIIINVNGASALMFHFHELNMPSTATAGIFSDNKWIFLDEHLDRLFEGLADIDIELHLSREELIEEILKTQEANNMSNNAHARLMVTKVLISIQLPTRFLIFSSLKYWRSDFSYYHGAFDYC